VYLVNDNVSKTFTSILILLVVAATSCNRRHTPVASTGELTADEYNVFSAYIAGTFGDKDKSGPERTVTKIVFFNLTQSGDDELLPDENGRPVPWEKTAEFLREKATCSTTNNDRLLSKSKLEASISTSPFSLSR